MTSPTSAEAPASTSDPRRDPGSFRDPGGFVYRRDGVLYRQIDESFAIADWEAFLASGLLERLVATAA